MKKRAIAFILIFALNVSLAVPALGDMGKPGHFNTVSLSRNQFGGHSAAIADNGDLYTWGGNLYGQLGHSGNADVRTPGRVPDLTDVVEVSLGGSHSAALTSNGDLYTWGLNGEGQLGYRSTTFNPGDNLAFTRTPTKVPGLSNVVAVRLGSLHSAAISADGNLYTWGDNSHGQLGYSSTDISDLGFLYTRTPTRVPGLSNVVAVSLGSTHSAAITANGDLYTWGYNLFGKLGRGSADSRIPTKVPGLSNVVAVSLGSMHSAAITANGDLYTWGSNSSGQLGLVDTDDRSVPTKVPGLANVAAVSLGGGLSGAVTSDGAIYTWGYSWAYSADPEGNFELGNSEAKGVPVRVPGIANVVAFSMGSNYYAAITANGDLYTWGNNARGKLGDGTTAFRGVPAIVMRNVMLPRTSSPPPDIPSHEGIGGFANFERAAYPLNHFRDVNENSWYGANRQGVIKLAYELGIVSGRGDGSFAPSGNILISEAIKMAAVVHNIYDGGSGEFEISRPWYQVYVDYAQQHGIIEAGDFTNYGRNATRAEMAYIFSNSVPAGELQAINTVSALPDVTESSRHGPNVFSLYRAGVLTGDSGTGRFRPNDNITRAEACAIIVRIALPNQRVNL